jgi:starvation-inducible DNA-binding protein
MEQLVTSLRVVLANSFIMYFKAHSHHWNVEGLHFSQLHDFLGELYQEVFASVDSTAEELRALQEYAPNTLSEMYQFKTINEGNVATTAIEMLQDLLNANDGVIDSLNKAIDAATTVNDQGLIDYLAGRLDTHKKHGWMIRSHLK